MEHVTRGRIVYAEDFKNHCVRRYLSGDSPAQIFRMAGLDSSLIGYKRIERCIARWKDTYGHDERVLGAVNDDDRFDVSARQAVGAAGRCGTAGSRFVRGIRRVQPRCRGLRAAVGE